MSDQQRGTDTTTDADSRRSADGTFCGNSTVDPSSVLVRPSEGFSNDTLAPTLDGLFNRKFPLRGYTDIEVALSRFDWSPFRISPFRLENTFAVAFRWIQDHKQGREDQVMTQDRQVWREPYGRSRKHTNYIIAFRLRTDQTNMMTWRVWQDSLRWLHDSMNEGKIARRPLKLHIFNTSLSEEGPPRRNLDVKIGIGQIDFDRDL